MQYSFPLKSMIEIVRTLIRKNIRKIYLADTFSAIFF